MGLVMIEDTWVDEFIQEVKKLAYDIPPPNPYTAMLLSHCIEAERHRVGEKYALADADFNAHCEPLVRLMLKSETINLNPLHITLSVAQISGVQAAGFEPGAW
jgi:hypothetical protein